VPRDVRSFRRRPEAGYVFDEECLGRAPERLPREEEAGGCTYADEAAGPVLSACWASSGKTECVPRAEAVLLETVRAT